MLFEVPQANLGGSDFDIALVGVGQEFGRAKDRVDDRADEWEERGGGCAADQERIGDPPTGVGEGEDDQGQPDCDQAEDRKGDDEVQGSVFNSEDGEWHEIARGTSFRIGTRCRRRRGSRLPLRQRPAPSSTAVESQPDDSLPNGRITETYRTAGHRLGRSLLSGEHRGQEEVRAGDQHRPVEIFCLRYSSGQRVDGI